MFDQIFHNESWNGIISMKIKNKYKNTINL